MRGFVKIQSWAGDHNLLAEVIGETPKHYRVRMLQSGRWPGRMRSVKIGDMKLVPKRHFKPAEDSNG